MLSVLHENAGYLVDDARRDALVRAADRCGAERGGDACSAARPLRAIARDGRDAAGRAHRRWRTIASLPWTRLTAILGNRLRSLPIVQGHGSCSRDFR